MPLLRNGFKLKFLFMRQKRMFIRRKVLFRKKNDTF